MIACNQLKANTSDLPKFTASSSSSHPHQTPQSFNHWEEKDLHFSSALSSSPYLIQRQG